MSTITEFTKGLYKENPVFRLALGLCPTLAVSTSIENGLGMGVAALFVLLGSNIIVSLIRKAVPPKIRIPVYIVIIATFVTIAEMLMQAFSPQLYKSLGIFVPLIVVNCIILGRAEAFAGKNTVGRSILDALGMGLGFTLALVLLGFFRELLGSGKLLGIPVLGTSYQPVLLMILPPGAFLTLGLFLGFFNWLESRK
ncbi:MAG: electron transport complex subunit RsxE [Candidatus Latescibacterota bacterium]|nr:MAG: electron transport complex subunit RsxE [Candidatus Latescibacteria bacterium 4484_107]RKY71553.1 MAG: electron transport complex subunit RsxE [Candidatus Latescibacterota bacterium]